MYVFQRGFVKYGTLNRVTDAKMQEKRDKKRERDVVQQIDGQVKILADPDRPGMCEIQTPRGKQSQNAERTASDCPA